MNPRAKKKAMAINQGISLAKALKAAANVSTFVAIATPRPIMATAPRGSGVVIIPTIVARKIERSFQAATGIPAGTGKNQITHPTATAAAIGPGFAPRGAAAGTGALAAAAEHILALRCELDKLVSRLNDPYFNAASSGKRQRNLELLEGNAIKVLGATIEDDTLTDREMLDFTVNAEQGIRIFIAILKTDNHLYC
mmetsp:Transcript_17274/g.23871  ORF Transcript_17274/g.23871 Transcript_17274/m.23871 type:complete len:196 (-) Transcript_17274:78-665(-)